MAWVFVTAASRKEQALNTFNLQMKFVTSLRCLIYANEVSEKGGGGGGRFWKDIFYTPHLVSKGKKCCQEQECTSKNATAHKVCTSTSTELTRSKFTKERFKIKKARLLGWVGNGRGVLDKNKRKRRKDRKRLELATDLWSCYSYSTEQIGCCWCNVAQQKQARSSSRFLMLVARENSLC